MFDATLLDSSPARLSVLTSRHWAAALLVAVVASVAAYFILPLMATTTPRGRIVGSVLTGVGLLLYELMLFYVLADARRLGLNAATWSVILLALNVIGFLAYLIYAAIKTGEWKRAALPLAYILQGVIVGVLLLAPLIHTEALPNLRWIVTPLPSRPPLGRPAARAHRERTIKRAAPSVIHAPIIIPRRIVMLTEQPAEPPALDPGSWVPGSPDLPGGGAPNGVLFSVWNKNNVPLPPPLPARRATPQRIYISHVEPAKLMYHPDPDYPALARMARVQGTVRLEAIISRGGSIQHLKALSGHPLLVQAAIDAVARWRYQPTLLNGEPVDVVTEVEVKFILGD